MHASLIDAEFLQAGMNVLHERFGATEVEVCVRKRSPLAKQLGGYEADAVTLLVFDIAIERCVVQDFHVHVGADRCQVLNFIGERMHTTVACSLQEENRCIWVGVHDRLCHR